MHKIAKKPILKISYQNIKKHIYAGTCFVSCIALNKI